MGFDLVESTKPAELAETSVRDEQQRPDVIPVKSSEVMRRCKIDITQWRSVDDAQREVWRNQARAEITEEAKTTGASLTDRIGSSETRMLEAEAKIESLEVRCATLSNELVARSRDITDIYNRLSQLPKGGNTP